MTTDPILTDTEIFMIGQKTRALEPVEVGYILPAVFARAIEQAVLQSQNREYALEAENVKLREALEMMVEMVEMNGFGRDYAMDVARAALAQKQEEKHDYRNNTNR